MVSRKVLTWVAVLTVAVISSPVASGYRIPERWTSTATDGGGLQFGDVTTLTWSFPDDGTTIPDIGVVCCGPRTNGFIGALDATFGDNGGGSDLTQRPWFTYFEQVFDRWSELGGVNYVYEPNDDNSNTNTAAGALGVRGDIRIAGTSLDGNSGPNTLAYNNFPNDGDMIFDTDNMSDFASATANFRFFRNTISHEHGHGFGARHVESSTSNFLMEPSISTSFDGPQFDDIRSLHAAYGDVYEKLGGDSAADAIPIGMLGDGGSFVVGTNGGTAGVGGAQTDFISIDSNSDFDYFSFTVPANSEVTVSLDPKGPTYNEGCQGCGQFSINASNSSNLQLALLDTDQTTTLDVQNVGGLGVTESINGFALPAGGTYYLRINGNTAGVSSNNWVQMYRLDVSVVSTGISGDFDGDGDYACADVDSLVVEIVAGTNNGDFDLTGDGLVNGDDLDAWLAEAGANELASGNPYQPADANLDGTVDGIDFTIWNDNKFTQIAAFCGGDFNADGFADGIDFTIWNDFKFTTADSMAGGHASVVPEPIVGSWWLAVIGMAVMRRRSQ